MKSKDDAKKSLEQFFNATKTRTLNEKPISDLLAELDDELTTLAHPPGIAEINSLIYRLGNAILAEHRAAKESPAAADLPAWQAAVYLMEIGNTASRPYQVSRKKEGPPASNNLIRVVDKARSVVLQIFLGKILTQDRETGFNHHCWDHPLFPPLIDWLGHGENQSGSMQEMKLIDSFLYQLSLDAAGTKTIPPPLREERSRIALAKVFSQALDREKYFELLPSSLDVIYRFNLIEIIPYLADSLWESYREKDVYKQIQKAILCPLPDTIIERLTRIAAPNLRLCYHWSIFCELWPKWVAAKTAEAVND